jgi:hypothetical protein
MQNNTFKYLNSKILIMGPKESGKTTLIRDIYQQIQGRVDEVHVFSQNDLFVNSMSNVISHYTDITNAIYKDFSLLKDFFLYCQTHHNTKKLVIIENILDHKQIDLLTDLIFNAKTYNVTLIITLQHPMAIKPEYRCSFDYLFSSFYEFIDQKKLYTYYFGVYPNFEAFMQIFSTLERFQFMGMKVKPSPYVIKHTPTLHTQLKFIDTKPTENHHTRAIKSKHLIEKIDNVISELVIIKKELYNLQVKREII